MKRPAWLRYLPVGKFLSPPGAVDPSATRPNLHRVMVRSLIEHRICLIDGFEERAGIDLLIGFDPVVNVEKMTAIEGHDLSRKSGPSPGRWGRARGGPQFANGGRQPRGIRGFDSKIPKI